MDIGSSDKKSDGVSFNDWFAQVLKIAKHIKMDRRTEKFYAKLYESNETVYDTLNIIYIDSK